MLQKWYQYKEKNRFNKERVDLRLRRIFLPKLYFDSQKPSKFKQAKRMALPLIAVFIGTFSITFLSSKSEAPVSPTNALTPNNYSLSLSVDQPNIDLAVDATPDDTFKYACHNISLSTNSPNGVNFSYSFKDDYHILLAVWINIKMAIQMRYFIIAGVHQKLGNFLSKM